jgi:hypothetical protein
MHERGRARRAGPFEPRPECFERVALARGQPRGTARSSAGSARFPISRGWSRVPSAGGRDSALGRPAGAARGQRSRRSRRASGPASAARSRDGAGSFGAKRTSPPSSTNSQAVPSGSSQAPWNRGEGHRDVRQDAFVHPALGFDSRRGPVLGEHARPAGACEFQPVERRLRAARVRPDVLHAVRLRAAHDDHASTAGWPGNSRVATGTGTVRVMRSSGHSLRKPSQRVPVLGSLFAIVATWRRAVVASGDRDKSGTGFALCRLVSRDSSRADGQGSSFTHLSVSRSPPVPKRFSSSTRRREDVARS